MAHQCVACLMPGALQSGGICASCAEEVAVRRLEEDRDPYDPVKLDDADGESLDWLMAQEDSR